MKNRLVRKMRREIPFNGIFFSDVFQNANYSMTTFLEHGWDLTDLIGIQIDIFIGALIQVTSRWCP